MGVGGSSSVLKYVRLAPLSSSLSLEAALGRDLRAVQADILANKASLALQPLSIDSGSATTNVLPAPTRSQVPDCSAGRLHRKPQPREALVENTRTELLH